MEAGMEEVGVTAERFIAIDGRDSIRQHRKLVFAGEGRDRETEFRLEQRYALGLSQRLALREASRRRAPTVLLLEDDAVFHPNFRALIDLAELPEDWGIFFLGCTHWEAPEWVGRRTVRVKSASDTHAMAVRSCYYHPVMAILDQRGGRNGGEKIPRHDAPLTFGQIPVYACYPNLVWQEKPVANREQKGKVKYTPDGRQERSQEVVAHLLPQMVGVNSASRSKPRRIEVHREADQRNVNPQQDVLSTTRVPRLGLLFLTRGDVYHPQIWREYVDEAPFRVKLFTHAKFPELLDGGFLAGTAIPERYETQWGGISLVRASRALLLNALDDPRLSHFVLLSESCVPVRPLPEILRRLELDSRPQFNFRTLKEASVRQISKTQDVRGIPAGCWRFTSQWWLMDRAAATFAAGCDYTRLFERMFVPDESYFATILSMQGYPLEGEVIKRNVTWTFWEEGAGSPQAWKTLPEGRLRDLIHSGAMFARKFPIGADIGDYQLHRSAGPGSLVIPLR